MDPDSVDFKFIIEFDDDGFDSEADSEEDSLVTSAAIERELNDLKHRLTSSLKEMETLQLQQTYFNPGLPPAFNWVEELNEKDLKASIRFCEYRIQRTRAQICNVNRKLVSARKAEELGRHASHVLDADERTLFVLGLGSDHCHKSVAKAVFQVYGDIENILMHRRHCFVTFATKESANKALKINGSKPLGRRIRARPKLQPYAFALSPLTPSYAEPPTFFFPFTFCIPRGSLTSMREITCA
ncbi:hypothetical protein FRB91_003487 [Serendipita sp. 411]|nr:hypothetical protein FRC19_006066 [Serendipita sp. 401]KAG8835622.1 hypothetical protein FRC18_000233 [Serendipita sp. 400]KAG8854490.1 hypothetical protein FRB91_003487 [Serendipita sp. 411]